MSNGQEKFKESLKRASRVVATWPEWKRNLLGRSKAESPVPIPGAQPSPIPTPSATATVGEKTDGSVSPVVPNDPEVKGSVVGCSCRYQWVGDRMRERLDALEKERSNAGTECDMLVGPCSCGAWHEAESKDRPNCPQLNILDPTPPTPSRCVRCGERKYTVENGVCDECHML